MKKRKLAAVFPALALAFAAWPAARRNSRANRATPRMT